MFTDYFGELPEEIPSDATKKGLHGGRSDPGSMRTLIGEILVQKNPQTLAAIYKKELQAWSALGVTTWSSSLPTAKVFDGFAVLLDRAG